VSKLQRRLVLTGHDARGVSRIMADRVVSGVAAPSIAGGEISQLWGGDRAMAYPDDGAMPAYDGFFPALNGARMVELYLPPRATDYAEAPIADAAASNAALADAAGAMEADRPGMHRTATTDLIIVMEGRCDMMLDEETVTLSAGDMLVQNGTMHAWFNPYDEPCRFLAVMLGAENGLCDG
jgi:mannose-6-phosphate isomerase-like protein (cupin superfamily)